MTWPRIAIAVLALVGVTGCSDRGTDIVESLARDPLVTATFEGVVQIGSAITSPGSAGAVGSPARLQRNLRARGELDAAMSVVAGEARRLGWLVEPNASGVPGSFTGTKRIGDDSARLVITPTPGDDDRHGKEFRLELSVRWG